MQSLAKVFQKPIEVQERLAGMGLSEYPFRTAVEKGLAARRSCTALDPPNYAGVTQWAWTVRTLRELLLPQGWKRDDTANFSTVVSPSGLLAIAVQAGDVRTGLPGLPAPRTRYRRGAMVHAAVDRNLQLSLLDPLPPDADDEMKTTRRETWMLLVNTRYDGVRFEMSCPNAIGDDARVASWSERILFAPLDLTPPMDIDNDDDEQADFDVEIERL